MTKRFLPLVAACLLLLSGCWLYSFTGTSIQPDVKTITINFFENKAPKVNPSLSNDMTEELRTRFRRMTNLEQVDYDGDLEISGQIVGYDVSASAVAAGDVAAQNRLTITVKVSFENRKYPQDGFTDKSFSNYADYDSANSLDAVESSLCTEIIDKILEDIFNATVAQW